MAKIKIEEVFEIENAGLTLVCTTGKPNSV